MVVSLEEPGVKGLHLREVMKMIVRYRTERAPGRRARRRL
jgi:hypothetical protein